MMYDQAQNQVQKLENEIFQLTVKLNQARRDSAPIAVPDYKFRDLNGEVSLRELFGPHENLIAIHNMGQGCRYCTTWADGINGFVTHLEDKFGLVLLSKDEPELQRRFANSRGWRFRMASHAGTKYSTEQSVITGKENMPGIVWYTRSGDKVFRKNASVFGPGDQFCSLWPILSLGGFNEENWTPQFNYWKRPEKMDDGGQNLV